MNFDFRTSASLGLAACAFATAPVSAETLPITGVYAAGEDAPSEFRTLVIEGLEGNEASKLALELRDAIASARIDGEGYFDVRANMGPGEGARPVGWISGTAFSEVERLDAGSTEESKCAKKDEDGECVRWRTIVYDCKNLNVTFRAEVVLMDARDELAYDRGFSNTATARYCANQSEVPSATKMVSEMAEHFAWQVRRDLAPIQRSQDIRVLEKRKGMDKPLRKPFKQALRLTKSDVDAACVEFERLNALQPGNVTLTFNAGLCREMVGDLEGAQELYDATLDLEPGKDYPTAGLSRLASRDRAFFQLASRDVAAVEESNDAHGMTEEERTAAVEAAAEASR